MSESFNLSLPADIKEFTRKSEFNIHTSSSSSWMQVPKFPQRTLPESLVLLGDNSLKKALILNKCTRKFAGNTENEYDASKNDSDIYNNDIMNE